MKKPTPNNRLEIDRGPNWLFVKFHPGRSKAELAKMGDELWTVAENHFVYRMVVEMEEIDTLTDDLVRQLAKLREQLEEQEGALRVCGLQKSCAAKLENFHLDHTLQSHASRESAILGYDNLQSVDLAHESMAASHFYAPTTATSTTTSTTATADTDRGVALTR